MLRPTTILGASYKTKSGTILRPTKTLGASDNIIQTPQGCPTKSQNIHGFCYQFGAEVQFATSANVSLQRARAT